MSKRRPTSLFGGHTSLATTIVLWAALDMNVDLHQYFLPSVTGVFKALMAGVIDRSIFDNIIVTFTRAVGAVLVSLLVGTPVGLLCGRYPTLRSLIMPIVDFIRGIPTSMLFPVFIIFVGFGETAKIAIAVMATAPILLVSAAVGTSPRAENQGRRDYLTIHDDVLDWKIKTSLLLWDGMPSIASGTKVATSISLVLVIVTEMFFVASSGLGWAAHQAYLAFDVDQIYLYIIIAGTIGLLLNKTLDTGIAFCEKLAS